MPRLKKMKERETRSCRLPDTRVSENELASIKAKAAMSGLSQSEYQRRACLDAIVTQSKPKADIDLILELRRQGRNFNNYQKKLNALNIDSPEAVKRVSAKIESLLNELMFSDERF